MDYDGFTSSIPVEQVINIRPQTEKIRRNKLRFNKILKAHIVGDQPLNTCLIGGDTEDTVAHNPPSIILEKNAAGEIARIVVKCSCGQHAELACQYED